MFKANFPKGSAALAMRDLLDLVLRFSTPALLLLVFVVGLPLLVDSCSPSIEPIEIVDANVMSAKRLSILFAALLLALCLFFFLRLYSALGIPAVREVIVETWKTSICLREEDLGNRATRLRGWDE